ncbi:MAG TPA: DUF4178 domain-containing protein, partial [Rubrivivax sp.]|nr:DUF4178 domain-containing protein [Rubrivivax sp.]
MATSPQRAYRAACPNCGAPVDFASAASAGAVCSFCRSSLVRDGDALRRIGVSGELFDDHSPLQLGARGTRQGVAFTLVGRLQYGYSGGTWNEWHALFDNGSSGWLSEDNGAYVLAFDKPLPVDAPPIESLRAGGRVVADGRSWDVASVVQARLIAAQGELPSPPRLEGDFTVVDLRNAAGEVATLDASDPARPAWSIGQSVLIAELAMTGLRDEVSEKTLGSRGVECPSCGAALEVKLATTLSVSCGQCNAVVDIGQGVGGELRHYQQNNAGVGGLEPQIPLGTTGSLNLSDKDAAPPLPWQVVGFMERCDIPQDEEEDTSYWREYLLYNREAGFAFLVDSQEGWSWVRPITGTPRQRQGQVTWQGATYRQKYTYPAKVTWVQGEFYWRVERDERAIVSDFEGTGAHANRRLSEERTRNEVTWSAGRTLDAAQVAWAFNIPPESRGALQRDVAPVSSQGSGFKTLFIVLVVAVVLLMMLSDCSSNDCDDVRRTFGASSTEYQQCQRNSGSGVR